MPDARAVQEVEVLQAVLHDEQGIPGVLPHMASPGDLLLDSVDSSQALSVLVQQPTYQVVTGTQVAVAVGWLKLPVLTFGRRITSRLFSSNRHLRSLGIVVMASLDDSAPQQHEKWFSTQTSVSLQP